MSAPFRVRDYDKLRGLHPAVVVEVLSAVELEMQGDTTPPPGPEREAFLADICRRRTESDRAYREGVDAMIDLLRKWDCEVGR